MEFPESWNGGPPRSGERVHAGAPLEILIHTLGLPIRGEDPVDLALGGSETAVISMARALQRLGHRVILSCRTDKPRVSAGLEIFPLEQLVARRAGKTCDLFLAARDVAALQKPVAARMYGTWHHDMPRDVNREEWIRLVRPGFARASFCLFLSRFHQEAYEEVFPGLARLSVLTTNGVDFDAVAAVRGEVSRDASRPRFFYASRPERGLDFLLQEIWPVLKRRLPTAELLVSSYSVDGIVLREEAREKGQRCSELIQRTPGVYPIGPLSRRAFWRELATCAAVLYPTDFPESSCMVALESQALGVPIVTTGRFALAETVGCRETLICDPWGSPEYAQRFVSTALRLVEEPAFASLAREAGLRHVTRETHSWDALASAWHELFHRRFHERFVHRKAGVLRRLLRDADLVTARRLVAGEADAEGTFDPLDLEELRQRNEVRSAAEPAWLDDRPEALPPEYAQLRRDLGEILGEGAHRPAAELLAVGGVSARIAALLARDHPGLEIARADAVGDGLEPGGHDAALLCQILETVEDPVELLAWAESGTRRGVAGYTLDGPWDPQGDGRARVHSLGEGELRELLGGKRGLRLRYVRCGRTDRGEPLGLWFFRYRIDPRNSPGRLDLDRKLRRTPPLPRLSAVLLVHNEEANVRRAVASLAAIADEIVIGDTGSTDFTVAIVESMGFHRGDEEPGRQRHPRRWVPIPFEDFAQARNALARHVRGDYVLWQDADEVLVHAPALRGLVDCNEYFDGFRIEQRHVVLDFHLESDQPLRCFRPQTADGPLQWIGCLHESVEHRLNQPPRRVMTCPEVYFAHLGFFNSEVRQGKAVDRNWPLFLKDRRENPGRWAGYVLGIREYLLLARWEIATAGRMTEKAYQCLNYGFEIWHLHVRHLPAPYRRVGLPLSRDILAVLARHKLPLRLTGTVPFKADLAVEICPGDRETPGGERPRCWTFFADYDEVRAELESRLADVAKQTGPTLPAIPPNDLAAGPPELQSWVIPPELFDLEPFR